MANRSFPGILSGGWGTLAFEPFRRGIEIHWLEKGATADDPSLALLRYAPGAAVPRHRHLGLETIVVLEGIQSDDNGDYAQGAVVLNAAGSEHRVWSNDGCVVLIHWTRPVVMLGDE
ncbi:MAG: cupin domain-containing protein [Xanthobacteraceae bacterium]|nr:cupin domain-containing protein [Xanthobacteraceae bacterium]